MTLVEFGIRIQVRTSGEDVLTGRRGPPVTRAEIAPQEVFVAYLRFCKQNLHYSQRFSEIKPAFCTPPGEFSTSPPEMELIT